MADYEHPGRLAAFIYHPKTGLLLGRGSRWRHADLMHEHAEKFKGLGVPPSAEPLEMISGLLQKHGNDTIFGEIVKGEVRLVAWRKAVDRHLPKVREELRSQAKEFLPLRVVYSEKGKRLKLDPLR